MLSSLFILLLSTAISKIKVFIVLHSHNDVGWLKTPDEYYNDSTQYILDNIIDILEQDPSLKFSWAEIVYLHRYLEENPSQVDRVKSLVQTNRLEIVGGGWVQHDEALPDYELALRNMQTGFSYLREKLNITKIKTGWQLDPFGHSSLTAALMEKMGFETLVLSRVDEDVRVYLIRLTWSSQVTMSLFGKEKDS